MFSVCICVIVSVHMYGGHRRWSTWSLLCLTPLRKNLLPNLELGWWSATSLILLFTLYSYYQAYKHMCDLVWDWGGFELRPSCLLLGEMSFQPLQLAASFEVSKCKVSNFVFQFRFRGLLRLSEILIFRHSQFLGANLLRSGRGCIDSKLGWKKAAM